MFTFRKAKIVSNQGTNIYWYLILNSVEAVIKYMEVDAERFCNEYMNLDEKVKARHLTARENFIKIIMDCAVHNSSGKKVYAVNVLADVLDNKTQYMIKTILEGGEIRVNQSGGYSSWESFKNIWNPIILTEIQKESTYFPTDEPAITTKYLFLENSDVVEPSFRYCKELKDIHHSDYESITLLKETDPTYIRGSIINSDNICIKSTLIDEKQLDTFMNLFNSIENKTLYLDITKSIIEKHPLYNEVSKKHKIIYVTY